MKPAASATAVVLPLAMLLALCGCEPSVSPPTDTSQSASAPPPPEPVAPSAGGSDASDEAPRRPASREVAADDDGGDSPFDFDADAAEEEMPAEPEAADTADDAADDEASPFDAPKEANPFDAVGDSEVAAVGAGAKGRDYGGPGFVTTPIEAMFRAEDRIVFDIHIPKNMSLYKAAHNNKGPKTHEEFMRAIIDEGGVSLPELPEGDEYWYDPKTEQLMIRHPAEE